MSSTYLNLNVHLVFSTEGRYPFLIGDLLARTHAYLGGTARGLGANPLQIGGVADHVHLLLRVKATHSIADLVREIKKSSTNWVQKEIPNFGWQGGYYCVTVSPQDISGLYRYIENQEEHHQSKTFEEERIELLTQADIEFDPRYLD